MKVKNKVLDFYESQIKKNRLYVSHCEREFLSDLEAYFKYVFDFGVLNKDLENQVSKSMDKLRIAFTIYLNSILRLNNVKNAQAQEEKDMIERAIL